MMDTKDRIQIIDAIKGLAIISIYSVAYIARDCIELYLFFVSYRTSCSYLPFYFFLFIF